MMLFVMSQNHHIYLIKADKNNSMLRI